MVNVYVHFRDWGLAHKETLAAAAAMAPRSSRSYTRLPGLRRVYNLVGKRHTWSFSSCGLVSCLWFIAAVLFT
jgi:hypothetical protein